MNKAFTELWPWALRRSSTSAWDQRCPIGTFFTGIYVPKILEKTGEYQIVLIIASCAYVVNLLIIHAINPRLKPMEFVPQAT